MNNISGSNIFFISILIKPIYDIEEENVPEMTNFHF